MHYTDLPCPNGCSGAVPMGIQDEGGPDPTVGIFHATYGTYVAMLANATSHDPDGDPLTEAQLCALQEQGDEQVNAPGYVDDEPIILDD